ncbi:hypothetical protein [Castellaniella sp.]|uniref:hypothetical protein n=1 Tax=Castellaniella sp. TaxID=1955812 RepID=UPI002AFDD620|nr:hypothetical protein [Castellaniella sp.]
MMMSSMRKWYGNLPDESSDLIGGATVEHWYQPFVAQRVSELSGKSCVDTWLTPK